MNIKIIECNPKLLHIDLERFPDRNTSIVYEHLRYYCSKFSGYLPSPEAQLIDGDLTVVSRHKYALVAQELNSPLARVVIRNASKGLDEFLSKSGARAVNSEEVMNFENSAVTDAWHVFFFEARLSENLQEDFSSEMRTFFTSFPVERLMGQSSYFDNLAFPFEGNCCEFVARAPVGDESWFGEFRQLCCRFNENSCRIISYQGSKFM